jgi:hypothetical protein
MGQRELRPKQPQIHFKVTRQLQDEFASACRLKDGLSMSDVLTRFCKRYINDSKGLIDAARQQFMDGYDAG